MSIATLHERRRARVRNMLQNMVQECRASNPQDLSLLKFAKVALHAQLKLDVLETRALLKVFEDDCLRPDNE